MLRRSRFREPRRTPRLRDPRGCGAPRGSEYPRRAGVLSGMSRLAEDGFARAALQSGCRFSAGLAEARALMATSRPELAEGVFARVAPAGPGEIIKLARARRSRSSGARNAVLRRSTTRRRRPEPSLRRGGERRSRPAARPHERHGRPARTAGAAELHALRARFAFAQGDPLRRARHGRTIECSADVPEAARVRAAVAMAEALAVCGRRDDAVAIARRWEKGSQRRLLGAQALAHWLAGSLTEAADEPPSRLRRREGPPGRAVVRAAARPHLALARGGPDRRCAGSARARSCCAAATRCGCARRRWPGIAQAAAQAGDAARAHDAIAELDRMPASRRPGVGEELGLARAWAAHVGGDRAEAIRIATAVANAAAAAARRLRRARAARALPARRPGRRRPAPRSARRDRRRPVAPLAAAHAAAHDDPAACSRSPTASAPSARPSSRPKPWPRRGTVTTTLGRGARGRHDPLRREQDPAGSRGDGSRTASRRRIRASGATAGPSGWRTER